MKSLLKLITRRSRPVILSDIITTLNTDMQNYAKAWPMLSGEFCRGSKYSNAPNCEYCRANPGKSETCKNCGAPTAFDAEHQQMMLTLPIIYNPLRVDASKISNKPRELIPIRS